MDFNDQLRITIDAYSHYAPLLIVWGIGILVALTRWRRHPRVSLLVTAGLLILAIQMVVQAYISIWLPITLSEEGMSSAEIGLRLRDIGLINILVISLAWVLILTALFGWRKLPASAEDENSVMRDL